MSTEKVDRGSKSLYIFVMMSPQQCRAARAWLGWSQHDLARRARVGLSTVKDFERGDRRPIANNLAAMARAIEEAGIRLLEEGGEPVGITINHSASPSNELK